MGPKNSGAQVVLVQTDVLCQIRVYLLTPNVQPTVQQIVGPKNRCALVVLVQTDVLCQTHVCGRIQIVQQTVQCIVAKE